MIRVLLVSALALAGCGGDAPDPSPPASAAPAASAPTADAHTVTRTTQGGRYAVDVRFDPPTPTMGELFAVVATVRDRDGEPLERGEVRLDALMPHHGHGMETDPIDDPGTCTGEVCTHPGGVYRTEGFKFHMPGAWTVTIEVIGPRGADDTSFVYEQR